MAKKSKAVVASMRPDEMASAGLPDDFTGEIQEVRLVPWDYDGNLDHHILAVRVKIKPDGDEVSVDADGFVVQHYSAGNLEDFVPSVDGEEPVDLEAEDVEEMAGRFAMQVGKRSSLNNNSNWAHFVKAAIDAHGIEIDAIEPDVACFEGIYGHFGRIPQQKRSGLVVEATGGEQRQRTILVLTEAQTKPTAAKGGKAAAKPAPAAKGKKAAPVADEDEGDDLDAQLVEMVTEALSSAKDNTLSKTKLPALAIKTFKGSDKKAAMKRVADPEFLSNNEDAWIYDEDDGTLTQVEE